MDQEPADAEFSPSAEVPERERRLVLAVYALQAASFLTGVTLLIGAVVNYVKRGDVAGTWLAGHHRWQIRTFWYFLLWFAIGWITSFILIGYVVLLALALWLIYRIVRGWLALGDGRSPYGETST